MPRWMTFQQGYRLPAISLLFLAFVAAGCATKQDVLRIDEKMNQLRNDQKLLYARVERIDSLLTNSQEEDNRLRVEMRTALEDLTAQAGQIQSQIEDLQQLIYRNAGRSGATTLVRETPGDSTKAKDTVAARPADTGAASSLDCRSLWDNAFKDMRRGQYDLAISGFSDYLKYCPNGDMTDNSQYWIAEAYYEMKQYPRAIEEYQKLLKQYPDTEKRAAAYFKIGRSYEESGDKKKAIENFQVLKKDFPQSLEYEQAKPRLEALQKGQKR